MEIDVKGVKCQALIDTGCEKSVVPRRMVRSATLLPTSTRLYAANGMEIHVLGWMRLRFKVQGKPLFADLLVSEDVDELMFSCEWLAQNRCH